MIPNASNDVVTQGKLSGRKVGLSVDLTNLAHIMNVLTDLYSDPIEAIGREYTTNAIDSHAMAGTTRPVEIFTPTVLRHTLEIQDYGLGMSADEVADVYGTYGASTKRETNDATGCLGLGSKSALTYTTAFNVRAVKDGKGVYVVIYRDDNGAGSMNILDEFETDDPNGVRVIIPTDDPDAFSEAINRITFFMPRGTVLVNGEQPKNYEDKVDDAAAFWYDDKTLIVKHSPNDDLNGSRVIMGNVAYPIQLGFNNRFHIYYFADMGEVEFVPSRESLNMTPKSKAVVESLKQLSQTLFDDLCEELSQVPRNEINNFLSKKGWVAGRYQAWRWNGLSLSRQAEFNSEIRNFTNPYDVRKSKVFMLDEKQIWINMDNKVLSYQRKRKFEKYIADNNLEGYHWILTARPESPVFDGAKTVPLEDIDAVEIPKVAQPKKVVSPPKYYWRLDRSGSTKWNPTVLPDESEYDDLVYSNWARGWNLSAQYPRTCFVHVPDFRKDKFLRFYPDAINYGEWESRQEKGLPSLDENELRALGIRGSYSFCWLSDYKEEILDPEIKSVLDCDYIKVKSKILKWESLGKRPTGKTKWLERRYPLVSAQHKEESLRYINMTYKESNV